GKEKVEASTGENAEDPSSPPPPPPEPVGPCVAEMKRMCKPCQGFQKYQACGDWTATCHKIFCAPLCLRQLWEVRVDAADDSSFEFQMAFNDRVRRGLESYFLASGCQDHLGCCPKGDMINNWAEQR